MRLAICFCVLLLLCGSANGQCVDGKCPVRSTAKATAKVVNQSVAKSGKLVSVLVNKSQHNLKAVCVKAKAIRPVKKVRGVLKSVRCR